MRRVILVLTLLMVGCGSSESLGPCMRLGEKEGKKLMRYHGVNGLRIEREGVYIKRRGMWIIIKKVI